MNALVQTDEVTAADYATLGFLVRSPELRRVKYVAQQFKISEAAASIRIQALRGRGWVSGGRGCCQPTVSGLAAHRRRGEPTSSVGEAFAQRIADLPTVLTSVPPPPREPRGSMEPPLDRLIDALAGFQDEALQRCNAQLRLRVTELEERNAELEARLALTLQRLAFAADALTG